MIEFHRCVQISETVSLLFLFLLSMLVPDIFVLAIEVVSICFTNDFAIQKSGVEFLASMSSILSFKEGTLRKPNDMQRLSSKVGSQVPLLLNFLQGHDFLVEKVSLCVKIDFNEHLIFSYLPASVDGSHTFQPRVFI